MLVRAATLLWPVAAKACYSLIAEDGCGMAPDRGLQGAGATEWCLHLPAAWLAENKASTGPHQTPLVMLLKNSRIISLLLEFDCSTTSGRSLGRQLCSAVQ